MRLANKESKQVYEKNVRIYQSITARDIVTVPLEGTPENLEKLLNEKSLVSKQISCHIDIHSSIAPLIEFLTLDRVLIHKIDIRDKNEDLSLVIQTLLSLGYTSSQIYGLVFKSTRHLSQLVNLERYLHMQVDEPFPQFLPR